MDLVHQVLVVVFQAQLLSMLDVVRTNSLDESKDVLVLFVLHPAEDGSFLLLLLEILHCFQGQRNLGLALPVVVDESHQCCPDLPLRVASVHVILEELIKSSLLRRAVSPLAEPEEVEVGLAELVLLDDDLLEDVFEIDELLAELDEVVHLYVVYTGASFGSAVDYRDGGVVETSEDAEIRAWVQVIKMKIPVEKGDVDLDDSLDDKIQSMDVITSFDNLGANIKLETSHHEHNFKNEIILQS